VFVIPGALLLALLAAALARLARFRTSLPTETASFALFAIVAFAVSLPASAYVRMLIPIVPPLLWLIVQALDRFHPRAWLAPAESTSAPKPGAS
jgi:hypothetical protein